MAHDLLLGYQSLQYILEICALHALQNQRMLVVRSVHDTYILLREAEHGREYFRCVYK